MQKLNSDERVYKEAELLYKKFPDFIAVNNNLRNWTGRITLKNNVEITLVIRIPDEFPKKPPGIMVLKDYTHKYIKNKRILVPYLKNWNERLHLYQVLNSILVHLNKEYPRLKIKKMVKKHKKEEKKEIFSLFDFESEKLALNEITDLLKDQRKTKEIDEKNFKLLFNNYLTEIKRIREIN